MNVYGGEDWIIRTECKFWYVFRQIGWRCHPHTV